METNCMLCGEIDKTEISNYPNWIKQLKLDGERCIYINGRLMNRKGIDITKRYNHIKINAPNIIADGELVFFEDNFKTNFDKVRTKSYYNNAIYVVFDILSINGNGSIIKKPLIERLEYLKNLKGENIKTILEIPNINWVDVENNGYEGLILKNPESTYVFDRSNNWLKVKNYKIDKFKVINTEITDKEAFVITIDNNGKEQRVKCSNKNIKIGDLVKIKFLEITKNGELRQPTYKE